MCEAYVPAIKTENCLANLRNRNYPQNKLLGTIVRYGNINKLTTNNKVKKKINDGV